MNFENEKQLSSAHTCNIQSRAHADINGVREVLSFDENSVVLITGCGELTLEGSGIRVGALDTERGIVSVDGKISALYYSDDSLKRKRNIFGRRRDG